MAVIASIESTGRYSGIIRLKTPNASLIYSLVGVAIIPVEVLKNQKDMRSNPAGCGPFKFVKWQRGSYIEYERFADYWEKDIPAIDGLRFVFVSEYSSAKASVLSGDNDMLLWAKAQDAVEFQANPNFYTVASKPVNGSYYVGFNLRNSPYDNLKVRQAVKYALDKNAILQTVGMGAGKVVHVHLPPEYLSSTHTYERNIEKAKALLREAGFPNGFKDKLLAPGTPDEGSIGLMVQSQLKAIGIELDVDSLEVPTFLDRVSAKRQFNIMILGNVSPPDPDVILRRDFYSASRNNIVGYKNVKFDSLVDRGVASFDPEERRQIYGTLGDILVEDAPVVPIYVGYRNSALPKTLTGFITHPDRTYDFRYLKIAK